MLERHVFQNMIMQMVQQQVEHHSHGPVFQDQSCCLVVSLCGFILVKITLKSDEVCFLAPDGLEVAAL